MQIPGYSLYSTLVKLLRVTEFSYNYPFWRASHRPKSGPPLKLGRHPKSRKPFFCHCFECWVIFVRTDACLRLATQALSRKKNSSSTWSYSTPPSASAAIPAWPSGPRRWWIGKVFLAEMSWNCLTLVLITLSLIFFVDFKFCALGTIFRVMHHVEVHSCLYRITMS